MQKREIKKITVTAVLLALGAVLSLIKVYELPLGGSITLLSMLPVCLISILYGVKWAIAPTIVYGVFQMLTGGIFGWGLTASVLVGSIFFDYIFAFGILALSGIFRKKGITGCLSGIALACIIRFVFHFISGVIFFGSLEVFNNIYLYSLAYNGSFMLPETVFTVIGGFVILRTKALNKLFIDNSR